MPARTDVSRSANENDSTVNVARILSATVCVTSCPSSSAPQSCDSASSNSHRRHERHVAVPEPFVGGSELDDLLLHLPACAIFRCFHMSGRQRERGALAC